MNALLTLLLLAVPIAPSVEYDSRIDFSRYATWSWDTQVTPAANPATDKRVREAIEAGLAARGVAHVETGGTLRVVYHASKTVDIRTVPAGSAAPSPATGIEYSEKGALVVELLDTASGTVVWHGYTTGVMRYGPREVAGQVKEAVDKLLAQLPPSLRPPVR